MKKKLKWFLLITFCIAVLQTLPIFFYENFGMVKKQGKYITFFYDKGDEKAGELVFSLIEKNAKIVHEKLNFNKEIPTKFYMYKNPNSLYMKKFGLITIPIARKFAPWYVGDNNKNVAFIISPFGKNLNRTLDDMLPVALHEFVHTVNYEKNKNLSYFLDNGVATYISEQNTMYLQSTPPFELTHESNGIKFGNAGGYGASYDYIKFIDKNFGWDKVVHLVEGKTFNEVFGKSEKEIYDLWVIDIKKRYNF